MKKIINKINFAIIAMMISVPAFAAPAVNGTGLCELIEKMKGVFALLRTLAFVGAAFIIAGWAWGYITGPKDGKGLMDDLKKNGTSMLVGFVLLFSIGIALNFFLGKSGPAVLGCAVTGW